MITRNSYRKKLDRADSRLVKRSAAYRKDPNEKNVHDLRTAIRRLSAAYQLLPRRVRNKRKIRKHLNRYNKLLKLNAKTRDFDIMMEKIQQDPSHSVYEELLSDLKKQRDETVGDAVKYASTLKYSPRLRVSIKRLAESDLKKRFGKIVGKYQARIKNRTRIVVKDSEDKDELHRLREDARRLRYTLELDKEDKTLEEAKALKEWQDILGAIHDSDIFIRRLEKMAQTPQISSLLKDEVTLRNRNYEKFRSLTA